MAAPLTRDRIVHLVLGAVTGLAAVALVVSLLTLSNDTRDRSLARSLAAHGETTTASGAELYRGPGCLGCGTSDKVRADVVQEGQTRTLVLRGAFPETADVPAGEWAPAHEGSAYAGTFEVLYAADEPDVVMARVDVNRSASGHVVSDDVRVSTLAALATVLAGAAWAWWARSRRRMTGVRRVGGGA